MQTRDYRLIVEGELSDAAQAELQGLFRRISDLRLTLLHAEAMDKPPEPSSGGRSHRSGPAGVQPESDWS